MKSRQPPKVENEKVDNTNEYTESFDSLAAQNIPKNINNLNQRAAVIDQKF